MNFEDYGESHRLRRYIVIQTSPFDCGFWSHYSTLDQVAKCLEKISKKEVQFDVSVIDVSQQRSINMMVMGNLTMAAHRFLSSHRLGDTDPSPPPSEGNGSIEDRLTDLEDYVSKLQKFIQPPSWVEEGE